MDTKNISDELVCPCAAQVESAASRANQSEGLLEIISIFAVDGCPYSKRWLAALEESALKKAELIQALEEIGQDPGKYGFGEWDAAIQRALLLLRTE